MHAVLLGLLLQLQPSAHITPMDLWIEKTQIDRANAPLVEAQKRQLAELQAKACETATKNADDVVQELHWLIVAGRQGTVPVGLKDALKRARNATKRMWSVCGY